MRIPPPGTITIKAEFGGRTVLICFMIISVLKYSHANFTILIEMTELEEDNSPLQKVFFMSIHVHRIEIPYRAFPERVGTRILSLESVENIRKSDFFSGRKKERSQ